MFCKSIMYTCAWLMDRLTLVADGLTTFVASQIQLHCFILCGYPGEIIPDLAVIFDVF